MADFERAVLFIEQFGHPSERAVLDAILNEDSLDPFGLDDRALDVDVDSLTKLQNADGGWSKQSGTPSDVATSLRVLATLVRAQQFDSHPFFN